MVQSKFALYNYAGKAVKHYLVEKVDLSTQPSKAVPEVSHHIFAVDRSGSMYYDMAALRSMMEKLLTLEEYSNASMLATLISYSSKGDVTVHFARKTVGEIMKPGSAEVEAIRQLRVTGLTCVSQALEEAGKYIQSGETTCISLHSDGYANDRSPSSEKAEIERICETYQHLPGVFINTIAYSRYSDFKLLASIANSMSGKCIQATSVKEVYDALHDTTSLLAGRMSPATLLELNDADYAVFVSKAAGRINGGDEDFTIRGLAPEHDQVAYRFFKTDKALYDSNVSPVLGHETELGPIFAFATAKLSEGELNTAKFAMMATRDAGVISNHYRALTGPALAAMHLELTRSVVSGTLATVYTQEYGLGFDTVPLTTVLAYLSKHSSQLTLDIEDLKSGYVRRGLKRQNGKRLEDGSIEAPKVDAVIVGDTQTAQIRSFDLNNTTANINILCRRDIELIDLVGEITDEPGQVIDEVAGIKLTGANALYAFNNYTIVGDGELCVNKLRIKIDDKRIFRQLKKWGRVEGDYDVYDFHTIQLADLPLVDFDAEFDQVEVRSTFNRLARKTTLAKILSAVLASSSARFTPEQVAELDSVHITTGMNFSPPTCNPYPDMDAAESTGLIDRRVSYKIDIGCVDILSLGNLHSGNALLKRFYTATVKDENGKETVEKNPKFPLLLQGATFQQKTLSARTKLTPIDDLMRPILDEFLGFAQTGAVGGILGDAGLEDEEVQAFVEAMRGNQDLEDTVEIFDDALKALQADINATYGRVRDLVFYIGATGLLPDSLDVPALTAEQIKGRHGALKIGKPQAEGTFFELPDGGLLSIYAKDVKFSVGRDRVNTY